MVPVVISTFDVAIKRRHPFASVTDFDQRMDNDLFKSELCQRPYKYLTLYMDGQPVGFKVNVTHGTSDECILCLTRFELRKFSMYKFDASKNSCTMDVVLLQP